MTRIGKNKVFSLKEGKNVEHNAAAKNADKEEPKKSIYNYLLKSSGVTHI